MSTRRPLRNRIQTTFSEITDRMELARHGAQTSWGLLTRTAATIAAHTLFFTIRFVAPFFLSWLARPSSRFPTI